MKLAEHPTVKRLQQRAAKRRPDALEASGLRQLCLGAGADDVGFVEIARADLDGDRADILAALPGTRALIGFVCRTNRDDIRSPARSIANLEFHHTGDEVNDVARRIVRSLEQLGVRAVNPAMGFPMEMDRFPGKLWIVSHKRVAEAAGLGRIGIHRNVIHPRFGNFVLLGTILVDVEIDRYDRPIDYNPCLECKLCVVQGRRVPGGDGRHTRRHARGCRGTRRLCRSSRDRRQSHVARLSGEGAQHALGPAPAESPRERSAAAPRRLRKVLSVIAKGGPQCGTRAAKRCPDARRRLDRGHTKKQVE